MLERIENKLILKKLSNYDTLKTLDVFEFEFSAKNAYDINMHMGETEEHMESDSEEEIEEVD